MIEECAIDREIRVMHWSEDGRGCILFVIESEYAQFMCAVHFRNLGARFDYL